MAEVVAHAHGSWVRDITRDAVRHFAWGVGDNNPLWLDPEHAARSRWHTIIAPPCFLYAIHETTVAPGLGDRQRIYRGVDWTWFDTPRLGDRLTARAESVETRTTNDDVLQIGRVEYVDDEANLVASTVTRCLRPGEPVELTDAPTPRRYSDEELAAIEGAILGETRRGESTRWWEDTTPGDLLNTLTKGPLSIMDIVAWCAGALGVPDPGEAVSAGGLFDEAATGPQLTAWFAHLVTDWAGDDAFLHRLSVTLSRQPGLGATTTLSGEVGGCWLVDDRGIAQLDLNARNHDGETLAIATALVILPSRVHGSVSLPIANGIEVPR